MKKRIVVVALLLSICMAAVHMQPGINSYAANAGAETVVIKLSGSRSSAYCSTYVQGKSGTTRIAVTMTLQRYVKGSWQNEKTWSGSKTGKSYTLSKTKSLGSGSYRIRSTVTVSSNKGSQTKTWYGVNVKY